MARLTSLQNASGTPRKLGLGRGEFTLPEAFDHMNAIEIKGMFERGD